MDEIKNRKHAISLGSTSTSICRTRFYLSSPRPIFLTTRPDLGDVPKGKLVTIDNFHERFNAILNPKQIERFRLPGSDIRWHEFLHSQPPEVNIHRLSATKRPEERQGFHGFEQRAAYFDGDPVIANQKGSQRGIAVPRFT
jgi:hypothetical protein